MRATLVLAVMISLAAASASPAIDRTEEFRSAIRAAKLVFCEGDIIVRGPLTIRAAEEEGLREVQRCEHCPQVPFGYMHRQWQQFKRQIRPGDRLVFFHCETKGQRGLLEGYAIIRNGKVWKTLIGAIS
jgi:hypothetical protein